MRRDHDSFRHAERFGLVQQGKTQIIFNFESVRSSAQGREEA